MLTHNNITSNEDRPGTNNSVRRKLAVDHNGILNEEVGKLIALLGKQYRTKQTNLRGQPLTMFVALQ